MNDQECRVRTEMIYVNSNKLSFYSCGIKVNKFSGSCNNIIDSCAKLCVPDALKDINVKVFNLMSKTNETRYIKWHETCKCKCRLVCNYEQRQNEDTCRRECKELIDKVFCHTGFNCNPSNYECECDKSCIKREYFDCKNCKCWNKSVDKLVEKCSENIDRNEVVYDGTLNDYRKVCKSYTIYTVLFITAFSIVVGISSGFLYFYCYLKKR